MRARYPDCDGIVVRDGVEIRYERYGQGWPGDPAAADVVAGAFPALEDAGSVSGTAFHGGVF